MYRIYADGREFGIDFHTLADARAVKLTFAKCFPRCRYHIRKVA